MDAWATANFKLRAHRDAMDDVKRREAAPSSFVDCGCTVGALCKTNAACPRQKAITASRKAAQQRAAQLLHAEAV